MALQRFCRSMLSKRRIIRYMQSKDSAAFKKMSREEMDAYVGSLRNRREEFEKDRPRTPSRKVLPKAQVNVKSGVDTELIEKATKESVDPRLKEKFTATTYLESFMKEEI